jgi:hypothetical protein
MKAIVQSLKWIESHYLPWPMGVMILAIVAAIVVGLYF